MGVWGTGNFERDDALDMLDWWYQSIIDKIRNTFNRDNRTTLYQDYGEADIVANIDILFTLISHYGATPNLHIAEILKWKWDYLETYDRTIHAYLPAPGFIEERRKIIEETFDKLYRLLDQMLQE